MPPRKATVGQRELEINEWDPETQWNQTLTTGILGPTNCGKTVLMSHLVYIMKPDIAVGISNTASTLEDWRAHIPDMFLWGKYSPDVVDHFVRHTKEFARAAVKEVNADGKLVPKTQRSLLLLDDVGFDSKAKKSCEGLNELFCAGRHSKLTAIANIQDVVQMQKQHRSMVGTWCIFPQTNPAYIKAVFTHVTTIFKSEAELEFIFDKVLDKWECLVYDPRAAVSRQPCLFFFKANPNLGNYLLCHEYYWRTYYEFMTRKTSSQFVSGIREVVARKGKSAKDDRAAAAEADGRNVQSFDDGVLRVHKIRPSARLHWKAAGRSPRNTPPVALRVPPSSVFATPGATSPRGHVHARPKGAFYHTWAPGAGRK
jgi:hypothetical protein